MIIFIPLKYIICRVESLSAYIILGEIKMGIYPFINKQSSAGKEQGFTLIEIIAILLLIAIVTVTIVSRRTGNSTDLIAAAEVLKGHLRYAQSRAMSLDESWEINLAGGSYTLRQNGVPMGILPGESGNMVTLSGITIAPNPTTVIFSSNWGIPNASYSITVSDGTDTVPITITSETGFIP